MNLSDVKIRVKRQFGDESGAQLTDDDILRWVNDGQRAAILANQKLLQKTDTLNVVEDQDEYNIPEDVLLLRSVSYLASSGLSYFRLQGYPFEEFNSYVDGWDGTQYGSGYPAVYTDFENQIKIFPAPNASVSDGLKLYYNRKPVEVEADDDEIDLPFLYHDAIVKFCLQQAYEMDENQEASNVKAGQFASDLRFNRGRENGETYPVINVLPDDAW